MKKVKYFISLELLLLVAGCSVSQPVFSFLQEFLSKTSRIKANILIIEGWLPFNDLQLAVKEFREGHYDYILTTGLRAIPDYYGMYNNGYLIFYPPDGISNIERIEVLAYSVFNNDQPAQFKVQVNDSLLATFIAGKYKEKYQVLWDRTPVDSILIEFDADKNACLFIKELVLNRKIHLSYLDNSIYDISDLDNKNRITNSFESNSELAAKRLIAMGVDSCLIIPVSGNKVRLNRTFTSATAVREWMINSGIEVKGINIISLGAHSRRTWMTFNKVLEGLTETGIIALPDRKITRGDKVRYLKTTRESIAFLYYCLLLNFI